MKRSASRSGRCEKSSRSHSCSNSTNKDYARFRKHADRAKAYAAKIKASKDYEQKHRKASACARKKNESCSASAHSERDCKKAECREARRDHSKHDRCREEDEYKKKDDECRKAEKECEKKDDLCAKAKKDKRCEEKKDRKNHKSKKYFVKKTYVKKWCESGSCHDNERKCAKDERDCAKKHYKKNENKEECDLHKRRHCEREKEACKDRKSSGKQRCERKDYDRFHKSKDHSRKNKERDCGYRRKCSDSQRSADCHVSKRRSCSVNSSDSCCGKKQHYKKHSDAHAHKNHGCKRNHTHFMRVANAITSTVGITAADAIIKRMLSSLRIY